MVLVNYDVDVVIRARPRERGRGSTECEEAMGFETADDSVDKVGPMSPPVSAYLRLGVRVTESGNPSPEIAGWTTPFDRCGERLFGTIMVRPTGRQDQASR